MKKLLPPTRIRFVTKKVKCLCRIGGNDIPPGLDPDDVALECKDDPMCLKEKKHIAFRTSHHIKILKHLKKGHFVTLTEIGTLKLWEDSYGIKKIHFTPSELLGKLETQFVALPTRIHFVTKRVSCIHRLMGGDIPPGLDPDDVTLECKDDPKCPEKKK